jgi:hypothetical protein
LDVTTITSGRLKMQRFVEGVSSRLKGLNTTVHDLAAQRRRLALRLSENPQQNELVQPKLEELVILEFSEDG